MNEAEIIRIINEAAYEVRLNLGLRFLESVYQKALVLELSERGLEANIEAPIDVR